MIDRCRVCGHPERYHSVVIELPDEAGGPLKPSLVRVEGQHIGASEIVCELFVPTYHVEGVL